MINVSRVMGMKRYLQATLLGTASILSGCDANSDKESNKPLEVIIESSETNGEGQVMFWDDYSDEPVLVKVSDVNSNPLSGINVRFLDGSDFEGFVLADPNSDYATSFQLYPHNSVHSITMYVSDSEPIIRRVERDSLEGRALESFERDFLEPRAIYIGRRTPKELDTQARNKLFLLGSFLGTDTVFSAFTETVSRLSDITGWDEPEFYDIYDVWRFDGMTTSLRHLVPVSEDIGVIPEVQRAGNSSSRNTRIAFASRPSRWDDWEIHVIDPDGNRINLTNDPRRDLHPSWSPDGSKVAFNSYRGTNDDIYVMDADGSNITNLTNACCYNDFPSWSPDGRQMAFESARTGSYEIYVMNADGSNQVNLTNNPAHDENPSWSPDGRQIAFRSNRGGNSDIYVMNADGTNQRNMTHSPERHDSMPCWSPDGRQIAFKSVVDGNWEVYVMNADGTNQVNLTSNPAQESRPCWSPDGRQIAFSSNRDGNGEIYVMDADGTNQRNITNSPSFDRSPSWSPFLD